MAKTQEELKQLKQEYESLSNKLKELSDDELKQVTGGGSIFDMPENNTIYEHGFYGNEVDKDKFIK